MTTATASGAMQRTLVENFVTINQMFREGTALDLQGLTEATNALDLELSLDEAYALQADINSNIIELGEGSPIGYKVSMTAPEDRVPVNATAPSSGVLFEHQLIADGTELKLEQMNTVLLEPELVFRTTRDVTRADLDDLAQVLEVTAGIEVPMSRVPAWFPPGEPPAVNLATFVADNSASGFVAIGNEWIPATSLDTSQVEVAFTAPDGTTTTGHAMRVMEGPLNAMRWLFERLLTDQNAIPQGIVVSSGTFMSPQRPAVGRFTAAFTPAVGTVSVTFQ